MFFLCLKIFFARIIDVSIGTFKTVLIVKGNKKLSTILAFFEVLIWFYVAKEALQTPNKSIIIPISYSLGYATGSLIGTSISNKFLNQNRIIKIISNSSKLTNYLKKEKMIIATIKSTENKKIYILKINQKKLLKIQKLFKNEFDII